VDEPLISIIVPIYKVENYIRCCIDSILNQTYRNLEIILVDDGSPDNCPGICDEYKGIDKRIKVIHKKNGGLSSARNAGLDIASGQYIGLIDSDDFIESDMYEALYAASEKYNADISVCGRYIVEGNRITSYSDTEEPKVYNRYQALRQIVLDDFYNGINNYAWDKLYKKSLFDNIRYPEGKHFEDIFTTYKLFSISSKIVHIQSPKYYYLQREDSIIGSTNTASRYDYYMANTQCLEFIKKVEPLLTDVCDSQLIDKLFLSINDMLISDYKRNKYTDEKNEILNKFKQFSLERLKNLDEIGSKRKLSLSFIYKYPDLYSFIYPRYKLGKKNIKHILKPIIPTKLIEKIKYYKNYVKEYKEIKNLDDVSENKIFLIGTPQHGNLGDQAIAYAENKILEKNFKDYKICEINTPDVIKHLKSLEKNVKKHDIFVLHGGGNLGDEYFWEEEARRKIISTFKNNKIVVFPQSIYFKDTQHGKKEFSKTKLLYSRHKNLTLVAREKPSYDIMKQNFENNNVILTPDIVMYLNKTYPVQKREGAVLCLRQDREGVLSLSQKCNIENMVLKNFDNIISTDTMAETTTAGDNISEYMINPNQREKQLNKKWDQFKKAEIVITDRLHGMVFCAITSTPCIAIANYNQKVKGTFEWIKNLDYIKFVNNVDEIPALIEEIKSIKIKPYDNLSIVKNYKKIIQEMRSV